MSFLSACQNAAIRLVGQKPTSIFSSTETFALELQVLANEVAQDIASSHDWQALLRDHVIIGDGASEEFPLPADYSRMLNDTEIYQRENFAWGYRRVARANDWLGLDVRNFSLVNPGVWTLQRNLLMFRPAPPAAASSPFVYISGNIVIDGVGGERAEFGSDDDSFVLSERLLTLGLVWKWREMKKLDATSEQADFEKAFSETAAKDGGARLVRKGRGLFRGVRTAWPWELG